MGLTLDPLAQPKPPYSHLIPTFGGRCSAAWGAKVCPLISWFCLECMSWAMSGC